MAVKGNSPPAKCSKNPFIFYAASFLGIFFINNCIFADIICPNCGSRFEKNANIACTIATDIKKYSGDTFVSAPLTTKSIENIAIKTMNCTAKFITANVYGT